MYDIYQNYNCVCVHTYYSTNKLLLNKNIEFKVEKQLTYLEC